MTKKEVGVLALQGDFAEHARAVEKLGARSILVKKADQLREIGGLILPGGESTTMSILAARQGLIEPLRAFVEQKPVWGTCAGLILLADAIDGQGKIIGGLDIIVERNGYGRQVDSFEIEIDLKKIGITNVEAEFIRAPRIITSGSVEVLGEVDGEAVAVKQGNTVGTTFHTELSNDVRFHEYFLSMC